MKAVCIISHAGALMGWALIFAVLMIVKIPDDSVAKSCELIIAISAICLFIVSCCALAVEADKRTN